MNTILKSDTIASVVAANIKAADVFKKYGIDFCCGGAISIEKACDKKQIDVNQIINELENITTTNLPSQNYNNWKLDFLSDYIVNTHHQYVLEAIPIIDAYIDKVVNVHGEHHPPLFDIYNLYQKVKAELLQHMKKEENILFPFIKQLMQHTQVIPPFGTIKNPITVMEHEHDNAGDIFKSIAHLTNNYTPPEWACNTFKALYAKLQEFEEDLHIHVHLENNILFPKAEALVKVVIAN